MQKQKLLTWITAVLENLFFAGAVFGWPNFVSICVKENFFNESCSGINETSQNSTLCADQSNSLSFTFTISSSVAVLSTLLTGKLLDKYGIWFIRTLMINLATVSYIIIASIPTTASLAFYFCFPIVHSVGFSLLFEKIQTANLFPKKRNFYVATISGAFDSGTIVYLIFNKLYFDLSVSFKRLLYIYAGAYFLLNIRTFFLTPKNVVPKSVDRKYKYGYKQLFITKPLKENSELNQVTSENIQKEKLISHLLKPYVLTAMLSTMIVNTLVVFYISNLNTFIESILNNTGNRNKEDVIWYSNIFGIVQLCGIIFAPTYGILIELHQKTYKDKSMAGVKSCLVGIWCSCVTAVLLMVCMLIPMAKLQIVSMFLVGLTKSFFFSANSAFLSKVAPPYMVGRLFGIITFASGCILLLQHPLRLLITNVFNNQFLVVNCGLLVLSFFLFLHPLIIIRNLTNIKKEIHSSINLEELATFTNNAND